jgi:hypothetical protein
MAIVVVVAMVVDLQLRRSQKWQRMSDGARGRPDLFEKIRSKLVI